jgi:DNA-binding response OmpR family regulator
MPGMDGFEVLERIMKDPNLRQIPVIMVSGVEEMGGVVTCIEMGAADYLHKPFDPSLLRARIQNCLEKKRLYDQEISLRAQLQDKYNQLHDLEKLRDSLTSMIVHDLRTPLTSLLTGLQTVELLGPLGADQNEILSLPLTVANSCWA